MKIVIKKNTHTSYMLSCRLPFIVASPWFNNPMITMQSEISYEVNKILIKISSLFGFLNFNCTWRPAIVCIRIRLDHFCFFPFMWFLLFFPLFCGRKKRKTPDWNNHNIQNNEPSMNINHGNDQLFSFQYDSTPFTVLWCSHCSMYLNLIMVFMDPRQFNCTLGLHARNQFI